MLKLQDSKIQEQPRSPRNKSCYTLRCNALSDFDIVNCDARNVRNVMRCFLSICGKLSALLTSQAMQGSQRWCVGFADKHDKLQSRRELRELTLPDLHSVRCQGKNSKNAYNMQTLADVKRQVLRSSKDTALTL